MRFDQPPRPSPSIVPSPERVAAFMAEQRARADQEVAAAFGLTKSAAVPQLISGTANTFSVPEWIWPDRIARGKLTLLGGAPGSGKSAFVTDVIARVTTGNAWPCQEGMAPKGAVLLIAPQGDADVFGLRFRAAGGDLAQLHVLREVKDGIKTRPVDLENDLTTLALLIEGIKDLRLIAIDAVPVPGGRGAAAARKAEALFDQLAALARRHNVAVLGIARQAGGDYLSRKPISFGTLPPTAATTAFLVEIDPNDESRRLLLQVKNELSNDPGTLAFSIMRRENAAAIAFAPAKPTVSPRAFTAHNAPGFNTAKAEAIAFLRALFAKATHLKVTDIETEARAAGLMKTDQAISQCRALRDARMALGLIVTREGFGRGGTWVWATPNCKEEQQIEVPAESEAEVELEAEAEPQRENPQPALELASPPITPTQRRIKEPEWADR
jgi:putative DNA primase/helicase